MVEIENLVFMNELDLKFKVKSFMKTEKMLNVILETNIYWDGKKIIENGEMNIIFYAERIYGLHSDEAMFDSTGMFVSIENFTVIFENEEHEIVFKHNSIKDLFSDYTNDDQIVSLINKEFEEKLEKFLKEFADYVI